MKRTNLSVFIPHLGCPNTCSFCNQRFISGTQTAPTPAAVEEILSAQQPVLSARGQSAEIAFFGGSFTAIDEAYRDSLLETAQKYVREFPEQYCGIRCSTRPDCIDEKTLDALKKYGMTAIELGAQSMDDGVLSANNRGHSACDVEMASRLIKSRGFELGLQMMTGLYGDSIERCRYTAERFVALEPATVRIYPTVILRGTRLDELREQGIYSSFSFDETVELCCDLLELFEKNNISVIRLGLHASADIERQMTGGVYHPAFREICESRAFYREMLTFMKKSSARRFVIYADKRNMSRINGHKGANKAALEQLGYTYRLREEHNSFMRIEEV